MHVANSEKRYSITTWIRRAWIVIADVFLALAIGAPRSFTYSGRSKSTICCWPSNFFILQARSKKHLRAIWEESQFLAYQINKTRPCDIIHKSYQKASAKTKATLSCRQNNTLSVHIYRGALMRRDPGFTLVEMMVVIAILGTMTATAMQVYHTYRYRTYGCEAGLMLRQILNSEIIYFLENDKFFPEVGQTITAFHDDPPSKAEIAQTRDALKITIPVGHLLDYTITTTPELDCMVTISSYKNSFALFKGDVRSITGVVDHEGNMVVYYGEQPHETGGGCTPR